MTDIYAQDDCDLNCSAREKNTNEPVCKIAFLEKVKLHRKATLKDVEKYGINVGSIPESCHFCRVKERV